MDNTTWIEWRPKYMGHAPDLKDTKNVQIKFTHCPDFEDWGNPTWCTGILYRFPASDLRGHNGGLPFEDAFDSRPTLVPGWEYEAPPRNATVNCDGLMCNERNCTDCFPVEPKRFTQQEFDSMGSDKFYLPAEYCPEPVINPKEIAGSKKPATWSVMPRWVMLAVGRVMSVGAAKYGAFNYRDSSISASIYEDAIERHLQLWFDGEDNDEETQVSHLASVIASCALLMDAQASGKLNDDRQKTGRVRPFLEGLTKLLKTHPLPDPQY